jgi:hypothetical protein
LVWKIQEHSFKAIAQKFDYTPMAITKAIENIKSHRLIDVIGEKEKFIRFRYDKKALWEKSSKSSIPL